MLPSFSTNCHFYIPFINADHEDFYEGRLFGETNSHVSAHLEDGVMTASIHVGDETYHIEVSEVFSLIDLSACFFLSPELVYLITFYFVQPSWRHLPHLGNESMIAYRASDIRYSWHQPQEGPEKLKPTCGYVKEGPGILQCFCCCFLIIFWQKLKSVLCFL